MNLNEIITPSVDIVIQVPRVCLQPVMEAARVKVSEMLVDR